MDNGGPLKSWLAPSLAPSLREPFERECDDRDRRRLLAVAPLVVLMHVVHVVFFWNGPGQLATLAGSVLRWRERVVHVHAVTLAVLLGLILLGLFGSPRSRRWLGPATVFTYLTHGAVIAGADQIMSSGVGPFIGFCLFMAVVVSMRPLVAVALYGPALALFVVEVWTMQPDTALRHAQLANGISIVAVSIVLAGSLYAGRLREFAAQHTIEEQGRHLAELNAGLEARVAEQVAEIVTRAQEVEQLNAQLQVQVQERSAELSRALARLAEQHAEGDRLRPGTRLGGRFEVKDPLGAGGMGVVYEGVDHSTGIRVAIKVVRPRSGTVEGLQRFLREAQAAATVTHPAIVRVLHVDVADDGTFYQAQELVEGETLQHAIERGQKWTPLQIAAIGATLSRALAAAHAHGIVHRDVKPSNVMLTTTPPGLKLVDFGIAKLYEPPRTSPAASTITGAILGTPAYMAPEQIGGASDVTPQVDVYALGVLLFTLLSGRHPFDDQTPWGMAYSHIAVEAPDVQTLASGVPAWLSATVARCLRKEPTERPTATDVAGILERTGKAA